MPRDPHRGEHVDEHQLRFATRIADAGIVDAVTEVAQLDDAVAAGSHSAARESDDAASIPAGVRAVGELISDLVEPQPAAAEQAGQLRVVFIGGQGRSGSTLLERALGQLPDVVSVGETVHLWDRGLRDNELCGCGQPFSACPFWSEVGQLAFGGWDRLDADDAVDLRFSVDRNRYLPLLIKPSLSRSYQRRHQQYLDRLHRPV